MIRNLLAAGAVTAALAAFPAVAQQQQHLSPLPPGEGEQIVAVACTQCHAPTAFTGLREDADAWRHQVYDMVLRGAQVGPGDIDGVVNYLASNFGPGINVPQSIKPVTLPDGPGKALVEQNCVLCHGLDRVAAVKRSSTGWTDVLKRMAFYGAPISGQDQKAITSYLDANFGAHMRKSSLTPAAR
jgi:mono/diheme cytochrome c family protein